MTQLTPDEQPFCGIEWLPHAVMPDGSPAPVICTEPVHDRSVKHRNDEMGTIWAWQDTDGNWLP